LLGGIGRIVLIDRVKVATSTTVAKLPNKVDTTVDISFTRFVVANAPKLIGV